MRYRSGDLLSYAVFTLTLHLNGQVNGGGVCKDSQGRTYETGHLFIPEPCTVCICDNGNPKWCKEVICTLPQKPMSKQDCKSFRMDGTPCCEFICLDNTLSSVTNDKTDGIDGGNDATASYDLGLRLVASCFTAILSLSLLFFLIHRLRQRKIRAGRQSRQLGDETRSLGTMSYLERGGLPHGMQMDDLACGGGYPLWKPPGNYFPRGEAPPPYEEAVAAARAEQALLSISPHALSPLNLPSTYLTTHNSQSTLLTGNANLPGNSPTPSNHGASPSSSVSGSRPLSAVNPHCHQQGKSESVSPGFYNNSSTTSFSMGNSTYENLPTPITLTNMNNMTEIGSTNNVQTQSSSMNHQNTSKTYHTTLPRQGSAFTISATLPSSSVSTHRTIPRTLATSSNLRLRRDFLANKPVVPLFGEVLIDVPSGRQPRSAPPTIPSTDSATQADFYADSFRESTKIHSNESQTDATSFGGITGGHCDKKLPPLLASNEANQDGSFESFTCNCSMQAIPTIHDDTDDYRSECENCKSTTGSRYYLDNENELVTSPHETMTLHRRPEETAANVTPQYYRTSLTLPTNTRQRIRTTGSRGNWIMPENSSESSDDD
ncbi:uncharacterized protein [Fopius arisanus]|uniref:Uncharacterized protein isoform X2 n=1 Tax=Fopius arisanus TaxID=64838 RepID=A0A9R1TL09_9HYME|nr:PREDICTED: uncharacterized protein LOC105271393 isoform X2 [Fopius arisanus]